MEGKRRLAKKSFNEPNTRELETLSPSVCATSKYQTIKILYLPVKADWGVER